MATYLDLVTKLLVFTYKMTFAQASAEQVAQALRHVNDAVRLFYNYGDLSFKTAIKRGFVYTVQTDPSAPNKGTPLPDDFLGFHQTGKVYISGKETRGALEYLPYHQIIERTEGARSKSPGIPTHYGLGGPSDPETAANQRELLLWPKPNTPTVTLTLVYQATPPPDIDAIGDADVEIPRIPATWHVSGVLALAKMLSSVDKGADESQYAKMVSTFMKQVEVQEPHGRERPARRAISPFWRR
jgi:hypothetical protein